PLFDMQAGYADYFAVLAALEQRPRAAAMLVGVSDAGYEASGLRRYGNEERANKRATALTRVKLGSEAFDRLKAEGRALGYDAITGIAFAERDVGGSMGSQ